MKTLFRPFFRVFLLPVLLLNSSLVFASHSFAGLDMCALYPEVMPPGLMPEQLPDAGGQAALLMQNYCTQCHELPGPGRHTAEEWPQVLDRMLVIMDVADRFGGLLGDIKTPSSSERDQLRNYLVLHALKPLAQTPQGAGANAFENHCSACHVLPDPAQYGVDWSGDAERSDVKEITGSFPAVYGWDVGHIGEERSLDRVDFGHLKQLIRDAHERGGINTISWHMKNPVTGRRYLDRTGKANGVPHVIPGGSHHEQLKDKLDLFVV